MKAFNTHHHLFALIAVLLTMVFASPASADVFFAHDQSHFIKIAKVNLNGQPGIQFSTCSAEFFRARTATCTDLAQVRLDEFKKMRSCEGMKAAIAFSAGGIGTAIGGWFAWVSFGIPAAGINVAGQYFLGIHSFLAISGDSYLIKKGWETWYKDQVYSPANASLKSDQQNHLTYEQFTQALKDSLQDNFWNCDVHAESKALHSATYTIALTAEESLGLGRAKKR